eukprot:5843033-Alexandrium_andersonii.AAC.1
MFFSRQVGAPRSGATGRSVRALSPIVRRPSGGGSEGAPVSLCAGVQTCPRGECGRRTDLNKVAPT